MFKRKLLMTFCGGIMMILFTSPIEGKAENISNKDFYDSYNTLLAPYASETIRSKLGPEHQYSLTDAKIINIERSQKYTFTFIVVAKYRTYTNAHNPPNHVVTITYNVSPSGVKVIDFKQKRKKVSLQLIFFLYQ
ncbi:MULTISPECIES: DUF3888 domain-containing protein [Bacillus]|uniref:DUF3888 domain-containing protein n=1 Tax=Bacillus TaxID=1386 RepID=UPI00122F31AD|nr:MULTISPECIES: DUF3888 domain-containing protein [Bacillus]MDA1877460.1 DUF3888 domain-containing protein [Bacillus cereus group sp. BY112LC]QEQ20709.1 DUF3888 domain-containing protein [Bacillus sp. BS98]